MPNLKDIKSRISSVQNTKKITKAMKMVAAAKVKKAEKLHVLFLMNYYICLEKCLQQ